MFGVICCFVIHLDDVMRVAYYLLEYRLVLFRSHLVSIEVALSSLVTRHLGDAWFDGLSGARQEKVREIHLRKVRRNVATGLEDCLYFSAWMELAARTPSLRQALGFESRASFPGSIGAFRAEERRVWKTCVRHGSY